MNFMTFHILGFSSSQPTVIFFKIVETNNQIIMCVYVTVGDNEGRLTFKIFFGPNILPHTISMPSP
jgi:hypothetical protein